VFKRIADFLGISLNLSSTSTQSIMERELLLKGKSSGKLSDLYTLYQVISLTGFHVKTVALYQHVSVAVQMCVANQKVTSENAPRSLVSLSLEMAKRASSRQ